MGMYGFLKTLKWIAEGNENEIKQAQAEYLEEWYNETTGNTEADEWHKEMMYMEQYPEKFYNGLEYIKYSMKLSIFPDSEITFALTHKTIFCLMEDKSYIVESCMGGKGLILSDWDLEPRHLKYIKDWTNCMNSSQKIYTECIGMLTEAAYYNDVLNDSNKTNSIIDNVKIKMQSINMNLEVNDNFTFFIMNSLGEYKSFVENFCEL